MKTKISPNNPFTRPTWAYGFESIPEGASVLDYGCFNAEFIDTLTTAKKVSAAGVDRNRDVVARYSGPNSVQAIDRTIPFPDQAFDVVTMFDVIEHIHDQLSILREINRVLKPGGMLIVSTPRHHIFSFLDQGNWKYSFPRIHKYWYVRKHSLADYEYRYLNNPNGLMGDVEKEKAWHQHFRDEELLQLLSSAGFRADHVDGYSFLGNVFNLFGFMKLGFLIPGSWRHWDNHTFEIREFCCRFIKV